METPPSFPTTREFADMVALSFISVMVLAGLVFAASSTSITSCSTISSPGTYVLSNDLSGAPVDGMICLKVTAPNTTIDCSGRRIDGPGPSSSTYGILVLNAPNVSLVNCRISGYGFGIYATGTSDLTNISSNEINSTGKAIFLDQADGNTVIGNIIRNSSLAGVSIYNNAQFNLVKGNWISGSSQYAIEFGGAPNNVIEGNQIADTGMNALNLAGSGNNNISGNVILRTADTAVYFSGSQYNTLRGNNISGNQYGTRGGGASYNSFNGDEFTESSAVAVSLNGGPFYCELRDLIIHNNTVGLEMTNGAFYETLSGIHFYGNGVDLAAYGTSCSYNATNLIFDNPAGDFANFSNVSINDSLPGGSGSYNLSWSAQPAVLPAPAGQFNGMWVSITDSATGASIDSIAMSWTDGQAGETPDDALELWQHHSWTTLNSTALNHCLSASGVGNGTIGVVYSPQPVGACMNITSPGFYSLTSDLTGAPNPAPEVAAGYYACIKVAASGVSIDCAGHSITGTSSNQIAALINGSRSNISFRNCVFSRYPNSIYTFGVNGLDVRSTNFTNISGFGVYAPNSFNLAFRDIAGRSSPFLGEIFFISNGRNAAFQDIGAYDIGSGYGIYAWNYSNLSVQRLEARNASTAINVYTGSDIRISECRASDPSNFNFGINVGDANDVSIRDCNITGYGIGGIYVSGASARGRNVSIERNRVINCSGNIGIGAYYLDNVSIRDNIVRNATYGIYMSGTTNAAIENLEIANISNSGIYMPSAWRVSVINVSFVNVERANWATNNSHILFKNVSVVNGGSGTYTISLSDGENATFRDISMANTPYGIVNYNMSHVSMSNITITGSRNDGIDFYSNSRVHDVNISHVRMPEFNHSFAGYYAMQLTNIDGLRVDDVQVSSTPGRMYQGIYMYSVNGANLSSLRIANTNYTAMNAYLCNGVAITDSVFSGAGFDPNQLEASALMIVGSNVTGIRIRVFNSTHDLYLSGPNWDFSNPGQRNSTISLSGMIIDNPAGSIENFTNITISDRLSGAPGVFPAKPEMYDVNWAPQGPLPSGYIPFHWKAASLRDIGNASFPPSIDYAAWGWTDDESSGYFEDKLHLLKFNGTAWALMNTSPDAAANTLSLSGLGNFSVFSILHNGSGPGDDGGGEGRERMDASLAVSCAGNNVSVRDGRPLGGTYAEVTDKETGEMIASGTTDPGGLFAFEGCGRLVRILLSHPGYPSIRLSGALPDCALCAPVPSCQNDSECDSDERCSEGECIPLACPCGQAVSHSCVEFECCADKDCGSGSACSGNVCRPKEDFECRKDSDCADDAACKIPSGKSGGRCEKVRNEGCGMVRGHRFEPYGYECGTEYGCSDCPSGFACTNHKCVQNDFSCPSTGIVGEKKTCTSTLANGPCTGCDYVITDPAGRNFTGRADENGNFELPLDIKGIYKVALLRNGTAVRILEVKAFPRAEPTGTEPPTGVSEGAGPTVALIALVAIIVLGMLYLRGRKRPSKKP